MACWIPRSSATRSYNCLPTTVGATRTSSIDGNSIAVAIGDTADPIDESCSCCSEDVDVTPATPVTSGVPVLLEGDDVDDDRLCC